MRLWALTTHGNVCGMCVTVHDTPLFFRLFPCVGMHPALLTHPVRRHAQVGRPILGRPD